MAFFIRLRGEYIHRTSGRRMKAEIISIGDEVLIGQVINTNAAYLGEQLLLAGMPATRSTVIGDDAGCILEILAEAWARSDIIIMTGGLGPTHDDVTRSAVVAFFRSELVFSPEVFDDIIRFFEQRGRSMLPLHRDQAMVPVCARVIRNACGTAPGLHIQQDRKHLFVLPGVPDEMQAMIAGDVVPIIRSQVQNPPIVLTYLTTGIPETQLAMLLDAPHSLPAGVSLAFLPSPFGVRLRISVQDTTERDAEQRFQKAADLILSRTAEFIVGEGEISLAERVGNLLGERGLRLAVAESCSGGMLANMITDVPGSSRYFERGVIAYSNSSKLSTLGIAASLLEQHGAVSSQVAMAMAEKIRILSGSEIGLGITGIAGPGGATPLKPTGLVWIGVSSQASTFACRYLFGENRLRTKQRAAQAALDLVRRHLLLLPSSSSIVLETITAE